jgi:hypothetical protein
VPNQNAGYQLHVSGTDSAKHMDLRESTVEAQIQVLKLVLADINIFAYLLTRQLLMAPFPTLLEE